MKCNYKNSLNKQEVSQKPKIVDIYSQKWPIEDITGYKPITTFYMDFSVAEVGGFERPILDTFMRGMDMWKDVYTYLTELAMVVNWKSWEHHNKGDMRLAEVYAKLYYIARNYALDNLSGEELRYYLEMTD